jgi:hypothetical protein
MISGQRDIQALTYAEWQPHGFPADSGCANAGSNSAAVVYGA